LLIEYIPIDSIIVITNNHVEATGLSANRFKVSHRRYPMVLKTYTRMFTTDIEKTLRTLKAVHGTDPHLTFPFGDWTLVAIGDVLVVGGTEETLAPIRGSFGPWIVPDIEATRGKLLQLGGEIEREIEEVPTGRMMYARHSDGTLVEYVEWAPELVERHILSPLRSGKTGSQI
jgi:hypothetical protein